MLRPLFVTPRFFAIYSGFIILFLISFFLPPLLIVVQILFVLSLVLLFVEYFRLFHSSVEIVVKRKLPKLFSLGDDNAVELHIENHSNLPLNLSIIDELPIQLQIRDFEQSLTIEARDKATIAYDIRPVERGNYEFANINCFISSDWGVLQRRVIIDATDTIAVYPSVMQMKAYELRAFSRTSHQQGVKKIRQLGHSYEFEQIKNYIKGDDYRSINWKASSRKADLMVNQYQEERSQYVYCIIDRSRGMRMPFEGLSLMDYAINTSLVLSNIILKKYDKVGLLTYADKMGTMLQADSHPTQLNKILERLYQEKETQHEANYDLLYYAVRQVVRTRSLLLLFTNFESSHALDRALPLLRRLNKQHLLVVIFFENTEIRTFVQQTAESLEGIYHQTIAHKFLIDKRNMVNKLQQYGIQAVLSKPADLSVNSINKYLELKARGGI